MSTARIYEAVVAIARRECPGVQEHPLKHLDIGAGRGELIARLATAIPLESFACDFHVERFQVPGVPIERVDLNSEPLPYAGEEFDLVTCSEVLEHLENPRGVLREIHRVLKPGGLFIVTTPNVANAYSRVRYLVSGFANLFGPLPVRNDKRYSTGGHISPTPYFYLAHALLDAGFEDIGLRIDKVQKTLVFWLVVLAPAIALGWRWFWSREEKTYRTLTAENRAHVSRHLSWSVLVGRTIVVSCGKRTGG